MPKPYKAALQRRPHAVVLIEWFPNVRPSRDFEGFDSLDEAAKLFDMWCEDSADADHSIVLVEVVDTRTFRLGRISTFGEDAERRADLIRADGSLILAKREPKARANISWVTDGLATGGDFSYLDDVMVEQLDDLLDQDLSLVVDCRVEESDSEIWAEVASERTNSPAYLHLPTDDAEGWNIPPEHFDAAVDAACGHLAAGGRVLVHCHMGVNRGPSTAYGVLLAQGHGVTDAFDLIRSARPIAGIAYAEDAVKWWASRQGWTVADLSAALSTLNSHIEKVLGPKEGRIIERAVRAAAARDRLEAAEIVW